MDPETNHQANHQFRRLPKGERRVRFADSMGMELVSIFLFDLINTYYFASIHNNKHNYLQPQLQPLPPSSQRTDINPSIKPYRQHCQLEEELSNNNNNNNNVRNNNHYSYASQPEKKQQQQEEQKSFVETQRAKAVALATEQPQPDQQPQPPRPLLQKQNSFELYQETPEVPSYICEFTQPISLISFRERVKLNKVHLETCSLQARAGALSVSCTIRVLNQSFNKSVLVRYTTDEWHTFSDCPASYKQGSNDGWSDKFAVSFTVQTGASKSVSLDDTYWSYQTASGAAREKERIIFAIKYTQDGREFWDNNGGLNYVVKKY